jgi:hypothetical protein
VIRRSHIKRRTRPRSVRKTKRGTLKRRCDALWSKLVRASNGGRCKLQGLDRVRCGGVLQAAHCFGRGHHSVRHELWNGVPLCAGHHVYMTHHPEEWQMALRALWGDESYASRWMAASRIGKPDYAAIEAELQEALRALA